MTFVAHRGQHRRLGSGVCGRAEEPTRKGRDWFPPRGWQGDGWNAFYEAGSSWEDTRPQGEGGGARFRAWARAAALSSSVSITHTCLEIEARWLEAETGKLCFILVIFSPFYLLKIFLNCYYITIVLVFPLLPSVQPTPTSAPIVSPHPVVHDPRSCTHGL